MLYDIMLDIFIILKYIIIRDLIKENQMSEKISVAQLLQESMDTLQLRFILIIFIFAGIGLHLIIKNHEKKSTSAQKNSIKYQNQRKFGSIFHKNELIQIERKLTFKEVKIQRDQYISNKETKVRQNQNQYLSIATQDVRQIFQNQQSSNQQFDELMRSSLKDHTVKNIVNKNKKCYQTLKNLAYHYTEYESDLTWIYRQKQTIQSQRKQFMRKNISQKPKQEQQKVNGQNQAPLFRKQPIKRANSFIIQVDNQDESDNKSETKQIQLLIRGNSKIDKASPLNNEKNSQPQPVQKSIFSNTFTNNLSNNQKMHGSKQGDGTNSFFNFKTNNLMGSNKNLQVLQKKQTNKNFSSSGIWHDKKQSPNEPFIKIPEIANNKQTKKEQIIKEQKKQQKKAEDLKQANNNNNSKLQQIKREDKLPIDNKPAQDKIIKKADMGKLPTTSLQYLKCYLDYSRTIKPLVQIRTKINNLGGARSEPEELYKFMKSYLSTISNDSPDQIITFAYKIYEVIVFSSIKNTNVKDGFEKMPPREKNRQAVKNSLNTYIMIINLFRVVGQRGEDIWVGIVSKVMNLLSFLFLRTQNITKVQDLELIKNQYVKLQGQVTFLYISRLDFLIYFLFGLLTFDPKEVIKQIKTATRENFQFQNELKRNNFKWNYKQFWCVFDTLKNNKFEAYWKILVWINMYSAIYLQIFKYKQNGEMKQFFELGKWIIKQVTKLTKTQSQQAKNIKKIEIEQKKYQFDGDEFISSIKVLGIRFPQKQKDLLRANAEAYRDNNSVLYYFWRKQ